MRALTMAPEQPVVRIGGAFYSVDLAVLPEERSQGCPGESPWPRMPGCCSSSRRSVSFTSG